MGQRRKKMPDTGKQQESAERDFPYSTSVKCEIGLTRPEIEDKALYYVLRLLNGASVTEDKDRILIMSSGCEFQITKEAFAFYELIKERVLSENVNIRGLTKPWNIEDLNAIIYHTKQIIKYEGEIDPSLLKIFMLKSDDGGCGFYRIVQPTRFIAGQCKNLQIEYSNFLSYPLGLRYDAILVPRASNPYLYGILKALQKAGKVIIYETDDLLQDIPDWNIAKSDDHEEKNKVRKEIMNLADGMIVSTEELGEYCGLQEKTHVCHNAIDSTLWPMRVPQNLSVKECRATNDKIKIMWAGSNTHKKDLDLVAYSMQRIAEGFQDTVEIIFIGYMPEKITTAYSNGGKLSLGVNPKYKNIKYHPGCHVSKWSNLLSSYQPNIILAPLVDCPFNRAKSELKALEGWAMGAAVIASDIAPFRRAIKNDYDGVLVSENQNEWYEKIYELIVNVEKRKSLAVNGLNTLTSRYLINKDVRNYEKAFLSICKNKIKRSQCAEMIEARLKELA